MNVEIRWENEEQTVIRYTYSGKWDWDDFYRILEQREPNPPGSILNAIVDFRDVTNFSSDAILRLKRAAQMSEEIKGKVVVINNSAVLTTLFNLFVTIYKSAGHRFRLVGSDEEAYAVLGLTAKK